MTSGAEHFRKLEAMYHAAPINQLYAVRLSIERGRATLETEVEPRFFHAAGALHGSVYFKALDDAAFFAVASLVEDVFVFTTQYNVHLLKPVATGTTRCEGVVTHDGGRSFLAESVLYADDGTVLARGSGTFVRSRIRLADQPGYGS